MYTNSDLFVGMKECPYCSDQWSKIWHNGVCPKVKSIEYFPDGSIKKVEFKNEDKINGWPTSDEWTTSDDATLLIS